MKRISTIFLRVAIVVISLGILAICSLLLPQMWLDIGSGFSDYAYAIYIVFVALYMAAVPFFLAMYGAWRLLSYIDKGQAFTVGSVKAVRLITVGAALVSVIYFASLPFFYIWADRDDAPGLVIIGMVLAGVPLVISVFAALLACLIAEATTIKTENELTV